ncbi:MAG TPA: hypothetical protein DIT64_12260 [Verrucomicrobiales bacterium]|nr:hypothetical protein [Verrucomicrobiales bacterium]HRJ10085.1 nuclear transport factor 2 family protein [Prosthecobacter sp.]HRK14274.1 nuclear transport factor 2 family protein [Prosthecobacter sp.]
MRPPTAVFLSICWLLAGCGGAAEHPRRAEISAFLDRYFSTWSARDMEGYGACFDPAARVVFVEKNGRSSSQGLTDFLHGQKLGHERSPVPMKETPAAMKISGDTRVACAEVPWRLEKGREVVTGVDYFTLARDSKGWRILALVFYND